MCFKRPPPAWPLSRKHRDAYVYIGNQEWELTPRGLESTITERFENPVPVVPVEVAPISTPPQLPTVPSIATALRRPFASVRVEQYPHGLAVLPRLKRVYVGSQGGAVSVVDSDSNAVVATMEPH